MVEHFESLARFRKAALKLGCTVTEETGTYKAHDSKGFPRGTFLGSGWLADSFGEWKEEYVRGVDSIQDLVARRDHIAKLERDLL